MTFLHSRTCGGSHRIRPPRERLRGLAHAGNAYGNEDDPAQPFRHVGPGQGAHAGLHRCFRGVLTIFFDLSRIASLGAFFYLVMDIMIHWGVFRRLRFEINAKGWVLLSAIALDTVVLGVFGAMKLQSDLFIVVIAITAIVAVFVFERIFLSRWIAEVGHYGHSEH